MLDDSWVVNLRDVINNNLEILDMLNKSEAQFTLDSSKEDLKQINCSVDYLTREIAREGAELNELLERKITVECIIEKFTKALSDGK